MKTMVRIRHDYISNDYYIQYPSVGRGSYGEVFRATHKITGIVRAAKKIERSLMTDESEIMKEYTALKQLVGAHLLSNTPTSSRCSRSTVRRSSTTS